jgi:hypothetical protein
VLAIATRHVHMVDQQDRLCADNILLSLTRRKPPPFHPGLKLDRPVIDKILSTAAIDISKVLPAAAHHCAIKGRLGFLVEASPVFPL